MLLMVLLQLLLVGAYLILYVCAAAAVLLKQYLQEDLEYDLEDAAASDGRTMMITTDAGGDMRKAVDKNLGWYWCRCTNHIIQLAFKQASKTLAADVNNGGPLRAASRTCCHFARSEKRYARLFDC